MSDSKQPQTYNDLIWTTDREAVANSGVTSTVLQFEGKWQNASYLIPHEAVRLLMLRVSAVAGHVTAETAEKFYGWYEGFVVAAVHDHHDAEEKIYFPWLLSLGAKFPDKLSADHEELLRLLDAVTATKEGEFSSEKLVAAVKEMIDHMLPHLAEEEEIVPGLLVEFASHELEGPVIGQIVAAMPKELAPMWMSTVVDALHRWGGPEFYAGFCKQLPPPVVGLLNKEWLAAYQESVADIKSIIA